MGKKQKIYSADIKARVALEALRGQKTVAQIASEHQVHPTQVNQWKKQAMETLRAGFSGKKEGELAKIPISYCLSSIEIEKGLLSPYIMLEVHRIPSAAENRYITDTLLNTLIALNSDFESGYKECPDILIPKIDYFPGGQGPFKQSFGQIKQKRLIPSYPLST